MRFLIFCLAVFSTELSLAQTAVGVGIYATGSETGMGFRSGKESKWALDMRVAKANIYSEKTKTSSLTSEISAVCRVLKLEKVRFHVGLGYRAEWNFNSANRQGVVIPVGVEAFPFPFQNAGLFFEAAPFVTADQHQNYYSGLRTSAGLVFYFLKKTKPALKQ